MGPGPYGGARLVALTAFPKGRSLRSCERNARKRARQTQPSAPPVQARDLSWWRGRFRLRIAILSQLLTVAAPIRAARVSKRYSDTVLRKGTGCPDSSCR